MYRRNRIIGGVAVATLATILAACGSSSTTSSSATSTTARPTRGFEAGATTGCTPAVMVVRHAEDGPNPKGGADILDAAGIKHAALYPELFRSYLAESGTVLPGGICPIGKIIAINPTGNPQNWGPGTNPYKTIEPLAQSLSLKIEVGDGSMPSPEDPNGVSYSTVYNWDALQPAGRFGPQHVRLKSLLANGTGTPTSTVIAWDKQGLYPSAEDLKGKTINGKKLETYYPPGVPLLKALPTNPDAIVTNANYIPERTDFYVFADQDPASGQFSFTKAYKQEYSNDGGKTWQPYAVRIAPTANALRIVPVS